MYGPQEVVPKLKVLITVAEDAQSSLQSIASRLTEDGLENVEAFQVGGVIAGEATVVDLSRMRRVPGVASIETDSPLTAI